VVRSLGLLKQLGRPLETLLQAQGDALKV
jgi:hypothetical protein